MLEEKNTFLRDAWKGNHVNVAFKMCEKFNLFHVCLRYSLFWFVWRFFFLFTYLFILLSNNPKKPKLFSHSAFVFVIVVVFLCYD